MRSKRFRSEARRGIFLGYMPHTSRVILWYDEGTSKVKIATHDKFDEGFNDLPADTLPPKLSATFASKWYKLESPPVYLRFSKSLYCTRSGTCIEKYYGKIGRKLKTAVKLEKKGTETLTMMDHDDVYNFTNIILMTTYDASK